jgi:hypothetical protein
MPKVQRLLYLRWLLFEEGDGLSKEVWVGRKWKPKLWSRDRRFFFIKISIIDQILAVRLEGLFWARNKVACSFEFGLWRLHTTPGRRLRLLYFIGYFKLIYLDSQQSLATQSHGLSTWTAIVWSDPNLHKKFPPLIRKAKMLRTIVWPCKRTF